MTFSIIGFDPENGYIGSAVASKWIAVGGCVIHFRPEIGMVNIQNHSHPQTAIRILDFMQKGLDMEKSLETAINEDPMREKRQIIVGDLSGRIVAYSGNECGPYYHADAGHFCAAVGNTLANSSVVSAMVAAFEKSTSIPLAHRLLNALEAGQIAGGDARGQEAAALQVFHKNYPMQENYPIDLRIDSHKTPIAALRNLLKEFNSIDRPMLI